MVRSTSGMAEDVICLLDYIGWTDARSIHVVGISLGGMIAQGEIRRMDHSSIILTKIDHRTCLSYTRAYHLFVPRCDHAWWRMAL